MKEPKRAIVFLVDDDNDLRESVEQALEGEGYIVLGARDGLEALARMRRISMPAVAVIDLMMPGMDGWELAKAMRADPALRHIPIIVVSTKGRAPVNGADRVLNKPVTAEALFAVVKEFLPRADHGHL
ncbi:MAG: response regulator [Myxococcaceae bacterium]